MSEGSSAASNQGNAGIGGYLKAPAKLTLEDKLFLVAFNVDKEPHLKLKDKAVCAACKAKPCLYICPVENYTLQGEEVVLSWEGCLECGTCRIVCPHDAIDWKYPLGGYGVNFRNG